MVCPKEVRPGRVTALDTMGLEQEIDWPLQQCHLESLCISLRGLQKGFHSQLYIIKYPSGLAKISSNRVQWLDSPCF